MVRADLDKSAYSRRFSDRPLFWLLVTLPPAGAAALLTAGLIDRFGAGGWLYAWVALNLCALGVCFASKYFRGGFPTKAHLYASRAAAVWVVFIVMTAPILMLQALAPMGDRWGVFPALLFSLAFCAYSIHEAYAIRTVRLELPTKRLPEGTRRLRVAQLSDLHLGPFMSAPHLERILKAVAKSEPDLLVITGDVADGDLRQRQREITLFREYAPALGVYCVPGNHDYYENIDHAVSFMEQAGMRVLRTQLAEVAGIVIVGMDDLDHLTRLADGETLSQKLLASMNAQQREKFVLLLRHRPVVEAGTEDKFDLQLSGHTHGGQLFPLPSSRHKIPGFSKGLLKLKEGAYLYVSNGIGFVGPPMRFLAPAEITIIDVVRG